MASDLELLALAAVAQLQPLVTVTPASTTSNGTTTSGTTETFDAVLGYYQVSLIAGRRYMAILNNMLVGTTVTNDAYALRIRNSGTSSNPTSASTQIAQSQWYAPGAGGAGETVYVSGSFIAPTTGLNTFGFSAQRLAGTGVLTPVNARELFVMYLGAV
jgi:hypothetical protein